MSGWRRWLTRPQGLPWRRTLVQAHLWLGLGLGVYVVVMSVTGSAVVLRPQFHSWLVPRSVPMVGERLAERALEEAVAAAYPVYEVQSIRVPRQPEMPVFVKLERAGVESERLFDPYAGTDLGLAYPPILHAVEWLVDLHDNLLAGRAGRVANGVAALLFVALLMTGAVLWWPGKDRWRHALWPGRPSMPRFARRLHNSLGAWGFALLLVWGVTAVYFAFPEIVERAIDGLDSDPTDAERPGQALVSSLVRLHFGRFGGMTGRLAWVLLGLVPAVLFVTGFLTWRASLRRRG